MVVVCRITDPENPPSGSSLPNSPSIIAPRPYPLGVTSVTIDNDVHHNLSIEPVPAKAVMQQYIRIGTKPVFRKISEEPERIILSANYESVNFGGRTPLAKLHDWYLEGKEVDFRMIGTGAPPFRTNNKSATKELRCFISNFSESATGGIWFRTMPQLIRWTLELTEVVEEEEE